MSHMSCDADDKYSGYRKLAVTSISSRKLSA